MLICEDNRSEEEDGTSVKFLFCYRAVLELTFCDKFVAYLPGCSSKTSQRFEIPEQKWSQNQSHPHVLKVPYHSYYNVF